MEHIILYISYMWVDDASRNSYYRTYVGIVRFTGDYTVLATVPVRTLRPQK